MVFGEVFSKLFRSQSFPKEHPRGYISHPKNILEYLHTQCTFGGNWEIYQESQNLCKIAKWGACAVCVHILGAPANGSTTLYVKHVSVPSKNYQ